MAVTLAEVAELVVRRAQRQGYVLPSEIRGELKLAELPEDHWKEVAGLAKASLSYRQGRYYFVTPVSPRVHQEQEQQRHIAKYIRTLIKEHRTAAKQRERRGQERVDFIQPLKIRTEDQREFGVVCRDLSTTGIRLLGTKQLMGNKIRVFLKSEKDETICLVTRILWTCAVGDDLFENGGTFLGME